MKKTIILAFITGIILTVFAYQAYTVYQVRNDHQTLVQIVDFINRNIQATQQQGQAAQEAPAKK